MDNKSTNGVQYSFRQPSLNVSAPGNAGNGAFSFKQATPPPPEKPPIGPEIGPDPRNAKASFQLEKHPDILDEESGVRYDFHHGFRIEMPQTPGTYRVLDYDMDSEIKLAEATLGPGQMMVGDLKYFIRHRLLVERDGKLIFVHEYDCTDKKVIVMIPDGALGDNLSWMPFAEAFREEHHAKVTCVCGEWLIRLVKDQYPELEFLPVANHPSLHGFYACYCCAIFPKERKNWRPSDHQNFGMQGSVAKLLGVAPVPHKVRFKLDAPRPFPEPYVCISAMATNPAKHWNYPDGWNILCRYLKRLGYRVLVIDREHELNFVNKRYIVPEEAEDWTGLKPIAERIEVLQHAEFFVGLPSGLSWLAWSSNVPVVMLAGFTLDGSEFPTPYRVTNFNACHGCWNDSNLFFDMTAPVWCPRHLGTPREIECTRAITPKLVINTVNRIPGVAKRLAEKKQETPEISVIITSYHGDYLDETILSIERMLTKSRVPGEIVLYDDASPKEQDQLRLAKLAAQYPDILRVIHGKMNLGAALGRNEAIKQARAKYLLIFDDDDLLLPFDLRKALDYMEAHPETPVSHAAKYLFSKERGFLNDVHGAPPSLILAFFSPLVNINAAIIRKDAVLAAGGFQPVGGNPKITNEDTDLLIRLGLTGPLYFDAEPRCLYRVHAKQLTAAPHPWPKEVSQAPCDRYPELYQRILKGDIPDVHGEDFRLVRGLMGAAFFFNQRDRAITDPILKVAFKEFPEDYGVWQIYFYTLAQDQKIEQLLQELPKALERFKAVPAHCMALFQPVLLHYQSIRKPFPPEVQTLYNEVNKRFIELPAIVRDEFDRLGIRH